MKYPAQHCYFDGAVHPAAGPIFQSIDPSTRLPLANIHIATHSDIDSAISSAASAFKIWSTTPPADRVRILLRAAALLRTANDSLATTETHDTGKPFSETSTVDVATGADVLEYFAHLVASGGLNGETTRLRDDTWVYTSKEPLGVCVGIGAWNYPLQIALWKSAPCLAAGNTMVYKPSEVTPLHAIRLAELYSSAGLPPGVFNIVHGNGASVGSYLTAHPAIAKVSFTGQVSTGSRVAAAAAGNMKYVTMELGGKSPLIILPDADLDAAADTAMMANFFSSGQVCTNGTRVFVPAQLKGEFEKVLVDKMQHIRPGALFDPSTNFGPLVSQQHLDKVHSYIAHGRDIDGATLLYQGPPPPASLATSFYCAPVVFTDCHDGMRIVREEIFGPVLCLLSYRTLPEAIARANATELGLAAGVVGTDWARCHAVVRQLDAGITWVNTWGESPPEMAVGGWKMSGVGVENGRRGIEAWVRNKSTLVNEAAKVPTVFAKR